MPFQWKSKYLLVLLPVLLVIFLLLYLRYSSLFDQYSDKTYFKDIVGNETPYGVSHPREAKEGFVSVEIIGRLQNIYEREGRTYFEVITDETMPVIFVIDMGTVDYKMSESTSNFDDPNVTLEDIGKGKNVTFTTKHGIVSSGEILETYRQHLGKAIKVRILTNLDASRYSDENCDDYCKSFVAFYRLYQENNEKLENFEEFYLNLVQSGEEQITLNIGVPMEVSVSQ